jgi:hypothetical protein
MSNVPEPHLRFVVFCADQYYPTGGLDDIHDTFDTLKEAKDFVGRLGGTYDYVKIYDRIEGVTVYDSSYGELNRRT